MVLKMIKEMEDTLKKAENNINKLIKSQDNIRKMLKESK